MVLFFGVFGCGPRSKSSAVEIKKTDFQPLSLEDSKFLITPTLYYVPSYDQSTSDCTEMKTLKNEHGKVLINVCKNIFANCLMQGTCQIRTGGQKILINVGPVIDGEQRFNVIKNSACIFGTGNAPSNLKKPTVMCLDPYYSVAADLNLYSTGDIVFIPSVVGLAMPDGSTHDGYFIVRDSGQAIKGFGRFDFFTGFTLNKSENPLAQAGFGDRNMHRSYEIITGDRVDEILKRRNYPLIPVKN